MDTFWIYKPKVLIENYYEILPTNTMSLYLCIMKFLIKLI